MDTQQQLQIKYDGPLSIATGKHRKELNWRNKDVQWSELVTKLSTTHRTAETHKAYLAAKKDRQDEIKDVGGFVAGRLAGGKRSKSSVLNRTVITLDLDFAGPTFVDDFTLAFSQAAVIYSTHKHSPDNPRLRLVMPLDREVFPDEYIAISRKVAGILGIELFDPTTFQAERMMYWPSTSSDGDYVFEFQDGPFLSADYVLGLYHDWTDTSEWPVSEKVDGIIRRGMAKQGDPLEKPGVVGAFCRAFTISEAISEFLADVYSATDDENRYTYVHGSTSGGLVLYDDRFAYSHHGTDPVSGKTCNAFDLVRLHKYGLQDEDVREGTPSNKLPSYTAMVAFAAADSRVSKLITAEKLASARNDFAGIAEEVAEEIAKLDIEFSVDRKGNVHPTLDNIVLILENDPKLSGKIVYDEFEQREIVRGQLPWRSEGNYKPAIVDRDIPNFKHYLKTVWQLQVSTPVIEDALAIIYERHKINTVKEYIKSAQWDGTPRVDRLLVDYLGADDTEYVHNVTRKTLVAAVARVFNPGCKFDYMPVIIGKQGVGKSSILSKLGGKWFSDNLNFGMISGSKTAQEQIQGCWIVEVSELAGLRKAEAEAVKAFISRQEDRYRVSYGRRTENFPRQCIFIGTTNVVDFLRDATGNRRYWPVAIHVSTPVKSVWKDLRTEEVVQIWAESYNIYQKGEDLYLPAELEDVAKHTQAKHTEVPDERRGAIEQYINTDLPVDWAKMDLNARRSFLQGDELAPKGTVKRTLVCAAEIWCEVFNDKIANMGSYRTKFIHDIMKTIPGWKRTPSNRIFSTVDSPADVRYGSQVAYEREIIAPTDNNSG